MQQETTVWNRCIRDLQAELPEQQFNTWIRPLQAVEDGPVLKLLAPNRFVVDWLNQHYLGRIEELIDELKEKYTIAIVTHSMQQAARVSQRTAYFHLGSLIEVGDTSELFTMPKHQLTENYITGRFG